MIPIDRSLVITPSLRGGGAERTLVNLLKRLDQESHVIELLVGIPGGELETEVPASVQKSYLFRSRFLGRSAFWLFRKGIFRLPLEWAWRAKLKQVHTNVLFFQDSFLTDLHHFCSSNAKKTLIIHSNCETNPNYGLAKLASPVKQKLIERRYRPLDEIYFVSESAQKAFQRTFGFLETYKRLPILFSAQAIRQMAGQEISEKVPENESKKTSARNSDSGSFGPCRFVCVGSLLPVKDHELLLRASNQLKEAGYDFRLDIVGDGPLRERLRNLIHEFGLEHLVSMHGFLRNPYPFIRAADVLVLPSVSEAMPTVLCEAHALSIPVLASDCGGCRDLLKDGEFGVLFERNPESLTREMIKMLSSGDYRDNWAQKGRNWLLHYDEDSVFKKYKSLVLGNDSTASRCGSTLVGRSPAS